MMKKYVAALAAAAALVCAFLATPQLAQSAQNIGVYIFGLGGNATTENVAAATVIKATPGTVFRVIVNTVPSAGNLTVNDSNAEVTAQTITAITAANNAVVTVSTGVSTNPFAVGNTICFASVGGMTQLNTLCGSVTAIGGVTTAWTITTSINSSAFTTYTSGGTAASFSVANQIATVPFGSLTAGEVLTYEAKTGNGVLVSAVGTGGVYSVTWN
jgi:hypothetical protein